MKLHLLTYADGNYTEKQTELNFRALELKCFDYIWLKEPQDVWSTKFYEENQKILEMERGAGYWLWKPFLIMETLKRMEDGDVLVYMDAGDWITADPAPFLRDKMQNCGILLTLGSYSNAHYTKRDCFIGMACDDPEYHNAIQVEAGIIVLKKCEASIALVSRWLEYARVASIITDIPNSLGKPNLPGFIDHRHDQSILTNLKVKHNLIATNEMRQFITCNYIPHDKH